MKKLLVITISLLTSGAFAQNKQGFTLSGSLTNLPAGKKVALISAGKTEGKSDTLAQAIVTANGFTLKGAVADPSFSLLTIEDQRGAYPIFIENAEMKLQGNAQDYKDLTVSGSKTQDEFDAFMKKMLEDSQVEAAITADFAAAKMADDSSKMKALFEKYEAFNAVKDSRGETYAKANPNSFVSPLVLGQKLSDVNALAYSAIYEDFSDPVKASVPGKVLQQQIAQLSRFSIGSDAIPFSGKTPAGEDLYLKDVLKKGKYTLIDFWASWCGPCRQENPNLVRLYEKYKDKGFVIVGVSLDNDGARWNKAIADDKLIWDQISDLKGWKSGPASLYDVRSIPAAFLYDDQGKLVGKNLRGEDLEQKLKELFD